MKSEAPACVGLLTNATHYLTGGDPDGSWAGAGDAGFFFKHPHNCLRSMPSLRAKSSLMTPPEHRQCSRRSPGVVGGVCGPGRSPPGHTAMVRSASRVNLLPREVFPSARIVT